MSALLRVPVAVYVGAVTADPSLNVPSAGGKLPALFTLSQFMPFDGYLTLRGLCSTTTTYLYQIALDLTVSLSILPSKTAATTNPVGCGLE